MTFAYFSAVVVQPPTISQLFFPLPQPMDTPRGVHAPPAAAPPAVGGAGVHAEAAAQLNHHTESAAGDMASAWKWMVGRWPGGEKVCSLCNITHSIIIFVYMCTFFFYI